MSPIVINARQLSLIADIVDEEGDARNGDLYEQLRADYTGRGVAARQCTALVGDLPDLLLFVTAAAYVLDASDQRGMLEALSSVSQDSMGRRTVFYWPTTALELSEGAAGQVGG